MRRVTSLAEVWIETGENADIHKMSMSLPLRKCGLKQDEQSRKAKRTAVTSLAEVWIETLPSGTNMTALHSHFPCGSVD